MSEWLPDWCMPGVSFRKDGKLHHIRAVVDDRAITRTHRGQEWDYHVLHWSWFDDQEHVQPQRTPRHQT